MHRWWRLAMAFVLAAALGACGGGGATGDGLVPEPPVADPTGPGELRSVLPLGVLPKEQVARALEEMGAPPNWQARYDVATYRLEYLSSDAEGNPVAASGLLAIPMKAAAARSPMLSWQHATLFRDAEAPSNNAVPSELPIVFASFGYLVAAADYVGYGISVGKPHPYLLAGPSAAAVVDLLTATNTWQRRAGVAGNGQLFLAGYSEGAYVSVAAHRALQAGAGAQLLQSLRLVVAGGGPYDVQATLDGLLALARDENPIVGALLDPGLLRYLGHDLREWLRKELLKRLLPDDADVLLDTRFIDRYLADDRQAIARDSSVHDWRPAAPVRLFHGRDDRTVPYASARSTLETMRANGAGELVSLVDCSAQPSSHLGCVPEFLGLLVQQLGAAAQDL